MRQQQAKYKIISGLLLAFIVIIIIKLLLPEPYINKALTDAYWTNKTFTKKKFDILIGGDSRVYRGVAPNIIESEIEQNKFIELDIFNIGFSGAGFSKQYLQFLENKLDSTSKYQTLILGLTPHSFLNKSYNNDQLLEYQTKKEDQIFKDLYLSPYTKYFAPYNPYELFDDSTDAYIIDYQNDGFAKSQHLNGDYKLTYWIYWDIYNREQVQDSIVGNFIQWAKTIKAKGINLVCYVPPTDSTMNSIETIMSGFNTDSIKSEILKLGGYWLDTDYKNYHSYDGSHLEFESAYKLSYKLSNLLIDSVYR